MAKIAVTGANGALGAIVVKELKAKVDPISIVALVRSPEKAADLGLEVRAFDYDKPEVMKPALEGISKLLLISSSAVGSRIAQHSAVVDAAKAAGVKHIVYTSFLKADTSKVEPFLSEEHNASEAKIKASGIPYTLLRNGYYTENHMMGLPGALAAGAFIGCAGDETKFACATREDYAAAAAAVLCGTGYELQTLELSGDADKAYTLPELAAEVSKQTGKTIPYSNLPREKYVEILASTGIPESFAAILASFDEEAARGGLMHDGSVLSKLIGRPTTPLAKVVAAALAK